MKLDQIHLRDPFILPVPEENLYYLYGTGGPNPWIVARFEAYSSPDLIEWQGPFSIFEPAPDFWADRSFWAPEVFFHAGRYFLFGSFTHKNWEVKRGSQILVSDSPAGPFVPWSDGLVTPEDDCCIDGTPFWDEDGHPWLVYVLERMQVGDGRICAAQLSDDLSSRIGEPVDLFRASEAAWAVPFEIREDGPAHLKMQYTTDGPFLHRDSDGTLFMLWSSFQRITPDSGPTYAQGIARSQTGSLFGPWEQAPAPLPITDSGHGMFFRTFAGQLLLTVHAPGMAMGEERPRLLPIVRDGRWLTIHAENS